MNMSAAVAVFLAVASLTTGGLILTRNYHSRVNQSFFLICVMATLWPIAYEAIYISHNLQVIELTNRLGYLFGLMLMFSVVLFTYYFPENRDRKNLRIIFPIVAVVAILSITDAVAGTVTQNANGEFIFTNGNLLIIFILAMLLGTGLVVRRLFFERKRTVSEHIYHQKKMLAFGFGASLFVGLALAVIAPAIIAPSSINGTKVEIFAPFALFFFLIPVGTAVARHKLFDIRSVIARSLGYILSLGIIAIISSVILFKLSDVLIELGVPRNTRQALNVVIILSLAALYQPLKKTFDKITRRLFYRDAYETQDFLNEFNETLVTTIDLEQLLKKAATTIEKYLRSTSCDFVILANKGNPTRVIGESGAEVSNQSLQDIQQYIKVNGPKVFISDFLDDDQPDLKAAMQKASINGVVRITKNPQEEGVGYILLGYKKNGSTYNTQDVGALSIVANELVIAVQNALQFEEIQQFNVTLQKKVDDATAELKQTNQKLRDLDETKDEFISMASHQLRTPLTSVKGYVSMVLEGDAGKITKNQQDLLSQAFISSQRMVYLIADLLNVSRLKTGKFVIQAQPTQLADVIEGELSQLTETAKGRKLELTYQKPADFPLLMLDETKIRQVIMNFVDNAIYYTKAGGHIVVGLKDLGNTIEFTVTDDGIGVPKSEQHKLFGKFYRAGNAQKARPDGTGLGLFMAQKVVVAQGGAIIFKSEEGKGSTFGFRFDKAKLLAKPDSKPVTITTSAAPTEDEDLMNQTAPVDENKPLEKQQTPQKQTTKQ